MNKIEQAGIDTKNKVLSEVLEKVGKGDFEPSFCMIRGTAYKSEPDHIFAIAGSTEATITIKAFIDACKNHKESRHQIDYIVASFVGDAIVSKIRVAKGTSEDEIEKIAEKEIFSKKEKSYNKTLIVFVISEDEVEFSSYGIVESSHKNSVDVVLSPEPLIYNKSPYYENMFYSSKAKMPNFFEMYSLERSKFNATGLNYDHVFESDAHYFPPKDKAEFIKSENKRITKFGY